MIADRFAFVHIPKTGGTWVRVALLECSPADWHVRTATHAIRTQEEVGRGIYTAHPSRSELGEPALPSFAFVRNPWDWHVSWFYFWRQHFLERTGGWSLPFKQQPAATRWWTTFLSDATEFEPFVRKISAAHREQTQSFMFARQIDATVAIGRFENLVDELTRLLTNVGCEPPVKMREQLRQRQPVQTTRHAPYRTLYTPELRELVGQLEAPIIERFGYDF